MHELLLTIDQAAQRLQVHPETIRRHLLKGKLRGLKRGKLWRVPESAIEEVTPTATTSKAAPKLYAAPVSSNIRPTAEEIARRRAELDALERLFEEQNAKANAAEVMAQFKAPDAEDIDRRLQALNRLGSRTPDRQGLPPLTDDAVSQGYDERAAQLMNP